MSQDSHRILFGGTVIDISDPDLRERIRVKPEWEKFQEIVSSLEDIVIGGKSVLNDEKTDINKFIRTSLREKNNKTLKRRYKK